MLLKPITNQFIVEFQDEGFLAKHDVCFGLEQLQQMVECHLKEHITEYCNSRNEGGNVLFNDALNTFYLRLNGVTHMVTDHYGYKRSRMI